MLRMTDTGKRPPRAILAQPMRVRPYDSHLPEEICVTKNVSRKGFYFETSLGHYFDGMYVHVTRNFRKDDRLSREEAGHIVRVEKLSSGKWGAAVHILPDGDRPRAAEARATTSMAAARVDHRRTSRARVEIPLFVYGVLEDGPFVEEAQTIEINAHGALIAMNTAVPVGERLLLTNEANERTQECTVLAIRVRRRQGVEQALAVAFSLPAPGFWRKPARQLQDGRAPARKGLRRRAAENVEETLVST
jgi:hypothetical protein